jgi:hypothetical protein
VARIDINHHAVPTDDARGFFAALDQQKSDGSPRAAQVGAQRLNPALAVFTNAIVVPAAYGSLGNIGSMLVKGYVNVMPYRQLLLSTRLPVKVLLNEFKSGHEERAKRMIRAGTGLVEWFLETQERRKIFQGLVYEHVGEVMDLFDRGEVEEARYHYLSGREAVLQMVKMENKLVISLALDIIVPELENALARSYAAQIATMIEDTFQKINLSTTVWGWMESRATAIAALLFLQGAARLRTAYVLDCLVDGVSVVQKRLFLSTHSHTTAWLTMVLGWEGDSWLLEVSLATATVLLEYEKEGIKVFAGLVIDSLEWILKVASSANRLSEVLALIDKYTGGLSDGASSAPTVPDGEQEGAEMGECLYPASDPRFGGSDVGRALAKVLTVLSKKHLDDEKDAGEA